MVYFNMDMVYLVWEYGSDRHIHRKLATFQGNMRKRRGKEEEKSAVDLE